MENIQFRYFLLVSFCPEISKILSLDAVGFNLHLKPEPTVLRDITVLPTFWMHLLWFPHDPKAERSNTTHFPPFFQLFWRCQRREAAFAEVTQVTPSVVAPDLQPEVMPLSPRARAGGRRPRLFISLAIGAKIPAVNHSRAPRDH